MTPPVFLWISKLKDLVKRDDKLLIGGEHIKECNDENNAQDSNYSNFGSTATF